MPGDIPALNFRLDHGWNFASDTGLSEFATDALVLAGTGVEPSPILVGKLAEFQQMRKTVWLDVTGAHAIYVMGKRRSGKSYTLGVIVEGLTSHGWIAQGRRPDQAVVVLDTMNVFLTAGTAAAAVAQAGSPGEAQLRRWHLPAELPRLAFFHPAGTAGPIEIGSQPVGLRAPDVRLEDWYRFFELDPYADPIAHLLTDALDRVARRGYSDTSGARIDAKPDFDIDDLTRCIRSCIDFATYDDRTREACARRLEAMQRLGVFDRTAASLDSLVQRGVASVLFLRDLDQSVRALFACVFVRRLSERRSISERYERLAGLADSKAARAENDELAARLRAEAADLRVRADAEGLPRTWVVIDEAHNYLPNKGDPPSRGPLKKLIDEGRNLGLSIVVATQQPSGLDPSIQRNADVLIVHSMSVKDDIDAAAAMLNARVPEWAAFGPNARIDTRVFEQLVRSLPRGYCLISTDDASRVFPVLVRPRISFHGALDY